MDYDAIVTDFAATVAEYCDWLEQPPGEAGAEHMMATELVARLIAGAVRLPDVDSSYLPLLPVVPDVSAQLLARVRARLRSFPVQYYHEVFHCLALEPEPPCMGDLMDDLGDIYADVKGGNLAYEFGDAPLAVFHWRSTFGIHWGRHATSGLRALFEFEPE